MVRFCYRGLPTSYKNCLWYSTIFSRGMPHVSAATMARRWVAQGLIRPQPQGQVSALEESRRCLDALCMLLPPHQVGASGRVKSFSVRPSVTSITEEDIPTIDDLLLNNQLELNYLDLVCSIRNEFNLQVTQQSDMTDDQSTLLMAKKIVMNFLTNLPTASARLLRVLYLQDYKGLDKGHLKNVCNIDELTFLSLRGTDIAKLPKQTGQLTLLQTLDIRQTRIKVLKAVLPELKHLLAGRIDCPGNDAATVKSKESFSTVRMPAGVPAGSMDKLEILSHVWVSDSAKELANIGEKLKQLRKLGVVLYGGSRANIKDLFAQINELHTTLRSLSIRMEPMGRWGTMEAVLTTPPMLLESLRICGVRDWLPSRIKELEHLAKVTLRDTLLNSEALGVLGALKGLRWLRLRYHSFDAGVLTFGSGSFPSLTDLVVEDDIVLTIAFAPGAAPKLASIIWSFQRMESLLGIKNLGNLRTIKFNWLAGNGTTNEYPQLQQEVKDHPNELIFDYKPINPMEGQAATF
uniref:Disease resistance R13L4/SHOC-2-like LRR domain-containing protein n=1 Tax=Oryza punctata TaxID=4537 RepID=A0A0E0MHS5_ORYPU